METFTGERSFPSILFLYLCNCRTRNTSLRHPCI